MTNVFSYVKNVNFKNRYISPEKLFVFLKEKYGNVLEQIGTSPMGSPIYMMSIGKGRTNIVAWSQMHGNESTATLAMLDLLESLEYNPSLSEELWQEIKLDFIWMLNPDGSAVWTRRNALDIDINRDFIKESSLEMSLLKEIVLRGDYHYALNLHDQRTIFTTDAVHPATLSFLAPSENVEREITENRKRSMAVIAKIFNKLSLEIPNQIGRYSDEFYPTSTGDNFMKAGIPTVLFEGGHFFDDYIRANTREYYTKALYYALRAMADLKGETGEYEKYFEIPENRETHYDVIYRNVKLNTNFPCVLDVAVQYREVYHEGDEEVSFVPYVVEVGDCSRKKGWKEIDCTGRRFVSDKKYPKLDAVVNFKIE
ncbi:peptidase M14 [Riemerella anatipestifer]|uniref:M14 family zinc carboxypeptidase n=1 Tax=Riemerella anatipestifer TaxID=34085 RepID=UPI0012AE053E|nr:M14 family zinc carboxypeptidase [Riemerella anatipestifer]USL95533.1 peptidase M14 [Riemerella anatipestifer]